MNESETSNTSPDPSSEAAKKALGFISEIVKRAEQEDDEGVGREAYNQAASFKRNYDQRKIDFLDQFIALKRTWSNSLLVALWIIVAFQILFAVAILILAEHNHKVDTSYAIVVSGGAFAELFGMCWLVVKHLFPSKEEISELSKHPFNIPPEKKEVSPKDAGVTDVNLKVTE